jgi:hypothetical protein
MQEVSLSIADTLRRVNYFDRCCKTAPAFVGGCPSQLFGRNILRSAQYTLHRLYHHGYPEQGCIQEPHEQTT